MGREPNKEDGPYRPAPGPGHPDWTPPPPIKRPKLAKKKKKPSGPNSVNV